VSADLTKALLAAVETARGDIQMLLDQAVLENGGEVLGWIVVEATFGPLIQRRADYDALIARAKAEIGN